MKLIVLSSLLTGGLVAAQGLLSTLVGELQTDSPLGTISAPTLPGFLTNNPLPQGFPWGTKTANNTNYYDPPNTGVIRSYDFTISRATKAPDGYARSVMLVNGQFPGPTIEANWGDTIQVTVTNAISSPEEGTTLHWHGLLQKTSQWMDGVPGVQQCPIPPGKSFTYTFLADLYGTSWYHSHYSAQYADGVLGAMVIHGPNTVPYDIDIGPVMLSDWYHEEYFQLVEGVVGTNIADVAPTSDNNLINGHNNFACDPTDSTPCVSDAGIANFTFTPGKVHRLRLINAGAEGMQKFSIDGHNLTVIANDFVPIIPYDTQVVTLGIGQRTDVLVKGKTGNPGTYTMRASIASAPCSGSKNPDATANIFYNTKTENASTSTAWPAFLDSVANQCANDDLTKTVPWYPITPDLNPPVTETIEIDYQQNATGHYLWTMNNSTFRSDYNEPILLLSKMGNNSYPDSPEWNVYNFGSNSSIRIVINNHGALATLAHPMHLHGHNMFVLDVGTGTWDGTIVNEDNPQRRDVQILPANGYMVLQLTADNPGAWPLHCHIAWHVSAGLYVTVLERPADIANLNIPYIMAQTCRDWSAYTNSTVVDQIDSGL
ncbi:hypothetical protein BP6252_10706 [Coleophoma cylindrospora]|uniref:laccase n=1 Tax=Coleophoma cylindrospora TaxID=1849047 RepID=A0A3D8QTE5_9HELO|nr:hypothetical protein BP6252_10706 [Coleophoma cylindrospora]